MKPAHVAEQFQQAVERGDWEMCNRLLADDFTFSGPTPRPLDKRACISMHKALWAGFPNIKYHFQLVSEAGDVVKGSVQITGTHTGNLIPPMQGKFVSIPPTGKNISLSREQIEYTVRGSQLVNMKVAASPEASWPGIFKQLGVDNPFQT